MKKTFLVLVACSFSLLLWAQSSSSLQAGDYQRQAENSLKQKEFTKARSLFLKASEVYSTRKEYDKAVACGLQVAQLYLRENYYSYAFERCAALEYMITQGEKQSGNPLPHLIYAINKERMLIYLAQKRQEPAKLYLGHIQENARAAKNDSINEDLLYTQANYYYTFGLNEQGDHCFTQLTDRYRQQHNQAKLGESYRKLIAIASKTNNTRLLTRAYEKFTAWNDSAQALAAQKEWNALQQQYQAGQQTIQEKEKALSGKQTIIIGLCVLAVLLVALLLLAGAVLLRYLALTRKQKKAIRIAGDHNELKTRFIQNISAQMEPTLNTLDASQPGVRALHTFAAHIQELSELENSLSQTYEMSEINVLTFCEGLMDNVRPLLKPEVTTAVNAPKLSIKTNPEQLARILSHLLGNAAEFTPEGGKIGLDYKKRGAHTQQFIVSDTGPGVPEALRDNLFKPFTEVKDLTQGDGLGLPICALVATKMNGTLSLESSYTKGCRFVLELHV
ncbi:MAG: HAMP domain-containing histidine kinase [Prevotellaceae bacterium]|jgi:signal transduction histidine kinase|nr:HAMP domain-containing histidine kinase [Prevotellaceae bacterium]